MNTAEFLAKLDKHAHEYNFPALDNAYVDFADARLSVFTNSHDWLIAFEVVGWSNKELVFGEDVYFYGNRVYPEGLRPPGRVVASWPADMPILDPASNECIANWKEWAIIINGKRYDFKPSLEEYASAGISVSRETTGPGSIREPDILRYLVYKLGHVFFAAERELLAMVPESFTTQYLFLQTEAWQHPDVLGGEQPSKNVTLRSLMDALRERNPALLMRGSPNTDWHGWVTPGQ